MVGFKKNEWKDFIVEECKSALRKFANQFTIKGKPGFIPETFLKSKNKVLNVLKENKQRLN